MPDESGPVALARRAMGGYWPVAWAVRQAFDEAEDFEEAVELLEERSLLSPVLLTVVGTRPDERVAVERSCDDAATRRVRREKPLIVTNHYISRDMRDSNVDLDESDTVERAEALEELLPDGPITPAKALAALSSDDVLADDTQHQVVMQPSTGLLVVRVPGGGKLELTVEE